MRRAWVLPLLVAVLFFADSHIASADEADIRLMNEPTSYTDVIDAFDEGDPFDLNFHVGFVRSMQMGRILREVADDRVDDARGNRSFVEIADHEHTSYSLELGLDVGLFRDLAVFVRLPLILRDTRTLRIPDGTTREEVAQDLTVTEPVEGGTRDVPLFSVPFDAPERSGLDYIGVGLAWSVLNQYRDPGYPTWLLIAEGRLAVGDTLHACNEDGVFSTTERCNWDDEPGMSRGTHALRLETRASKRYRYIEPYGGLLFQIEWPSSAKDSFEPGGDLSGFVNELPPRVGEITAGMAVIPWEQPGKWQRLSIDLRLTAAYVSEGHDYSPLFDALGTSESRYLREANLEGTPTPGFTAPRAVPFFGLTDTQAHARFGGQLMVEMWAAKFVRFGLGAALSYSTPYLITYTDACNSDVNPRAGGDPRQGSCRRGILNPHHRSVIDTPGRRFRLDGEIGLDLFALAVAQL